MNKIILMGRLTKDPDMRYTQGKEPMAIAKYTLAVNRGFKREGEPNADFINCVAFGKRGEFASKYFQKGQMVAVVGHLQISTYDDKDGVKRWSTDVIVEEQHFAESKRSFEERKEDNPENRPSVEESGFVPVSKEFDNEDDLPF